MRLTKVERNVVYNAVKESVLDLSECKIEVVGTSRARIIHSSGSEFTIINHPDNYAAYSRVTDDHEVFSIDNYPDVETVLHYTSNILTWAKNVKEFIETPDLWIEMANNRVFAINIQQADAGNTPFTNDERRRIVVELEAIKEQVKEQFDLTSEQIAGIDEWKDEVAQASERIGRKDWRLLAYGTIINLVVTDALPPEVARHILAMFIQVIAHLFLGGGGPPRVLT